MTALRQRLIEDLQLRNFSTHTIEAYVRAVAHFARHHGRSPDQLTGEQVRQYLLWMVKEQHTPAHTPDPRPPAIGRAADSCFNRTGHSLDSKQAP